MEQKNIKYWIKFVLALVVGIIAGKLVAVYVGLENTVFIITCILLATLSFYIGRKLTAWYAKKPTAKPIVFKIIAGLGIIAWIIPVTGFLVSGSVYEASKNTKLNKTLFIVLTYVFLALSIFSQVINSLPANLVSIN